MFFRHSNVKFGVTNIEIEDHEHDLSFVLNKKRGQPCLRWHCDTYNKPVLVCRPCKFIQHAHPDSCSDPLMYTDSTYYRMQSLYFQHI